MTLNRPIRADRNSHNKWCIPHATCLNCGKPGATLTPDTHFCLVCDYLSLKHPDEFNRRHQAHQERNR